jgi:long-chain acyl-CoA synthetase
LDRGFLLMLGDHPSPPNHATAARWIRYHARCRPKAIAWWHWNDGHWVGSDWSTCHRWMISLTRQIQQECIPSGSRIASQLPNGTPWWLLEAACQALGLVHVPIDWRWSNLATLDLIQRTAPHRMVIDQDRVGDRWLSGLSDNRMLRTLPLEKGCRAPSENDGVLRWDWEPMPTDEDLDPFDFPLIDPDPETLATILWTSGTTHSPKGVMLSYSNLGSNAHAKLLALPQSHDDIRLNLLPWSHAYARTCELSAWWISGSQLAVATGSPDWHDMATTLRPTLINAVPLQLSRWHDKMLREYGEVSRMAMEQTAGDRLRCLASGGAGLAEEIRNRFATAGWPILQGYGLTEASPVVCSNTVEDLQNGLWSDGSVGQPVQGTQLLLDSEQQLWVRGPQLMLGYFQAEEETSQRIVDGWLATGDRARVGQHGRWFIEGRLDDLIVLPSAKKFFPAPIETALRSAGFSDCLVCLDARDQLIAFGIVPEERLLPTNDWEVAIDLQAAIEVWPKDPKAPKTPILGTVPISKVATLLDRFPKHQWPRGIYAVSQSSIDFSTMRTAKGTWIRPRVLSHLLSLLSESPDSGDRTAGTKKNS